MSTFFFGTLQKAVYMVSCDTLWKFTGIPSERTALSVTRAVLSAGGSLSPTIRTLGPTYLPFFTYFDLLKYFLATGTFAVVFALKSTCGPLAPPASSYPGRPGWMKWVAMSPTVGPPRVLRSASRSIAAYTALRRFGSLNGVSCVFSAMYRLPWPLVNEICFLYFVTPSLTIGAGGDSPETASLPVRICRPATVTSAPSCPSILSTYAGRKSFFGSQFGLRTSTTLLPAL